MATGKSAQSGKQADDLKGEITMKYRSFARLTASLLLLVSGVVGGIANAQPATPYVEDLSAIERDLGPHSTYADVQAAVGNGQAATALRVTVGRTGDWTYRGPWTPTSANERLAIFSDDGCTITIQPLAGGRAKR